MEENKIKESGIIEGQNSADVQEECRKDEVKDEEICLRTYQQGKEVLIAACDSDILGKEFREGSLHIAVSSDFFGEERAGIPELEDALKGATMANFVGCKAVRHAIRLGYVDEDNVLCIDGVLYAQMVRM